MKTLITLTTDFGTKDGYVGAMKGRILSLCSGATLVDITHDIPPQDLINAAWCITRAAPRFPDNTIHIVVVDPGVGSRRAAIFFNYQRQWFVGPDNGVFDAILSAADTVKIFEAYPETQWWQPHQSFDGLAVFSPLAACLANGIDPNKLGRAIQRWKRLPEKAPNIGERFIEGIIIMFDHFGNAITNIMADSLPQKSVDPISITAKNLSFELCQHYSQGKSAVPIAIINSDNRLELSTYAGSARQTFGLIIGTPVRVDWKS